MSQQVIKLRINKQGQVKIIDVCNGGENCRTVTANFERRLGIVDENSRNTTESLYYREIEGEREITLG